MSRAKGQKNSVRLTVTLDESEHAELSKLATTLDLSVSWMIRRAVSEFIERHRNGIEADLPLRSPKADSRKKKKNESAVDKQTGEDV